MIIAFFEQFSYGERQSNCVIDYKSKAVSQLSLVVEKFFLIYFIVYKTLIYEREHLHNVEYQ